MILILFNYLLTPFLNNYSYLTAFLASISLSNSANLSLKIALIYRFLNILNTKFCAVWLQNTQNSRKQFRIKKNSFPRQSLEKIYLSCQIKWLKNFLVWSFSYRQLIWHKKSILLSLTRGKYCLIHLEYCKDNQKMILLGWNLVWNKIMLPPTPTQKYNDSIRFRRKMSFVTSFTISKWLKIILLPNFDESQVKFSTKMICQPTIIIMDSKVCHTNLTISKIESQRVTFYLYIFALCLFFI